MTKKDYELIAAVIEMRYFSEGIGRLGIYKLALSLADNFADANPRFDRIKFLTSCGLEEPCKCTGGTHDDPDCAEFEEEINPFDIVTHINGKKITK